MAAYIQSLINLVKESWFCPPDYQIIRLSIILSDYPSYYQIIRLYIRFTSIWSWKTTTTLYLPPILTDVTAADVGHLLQGLEGDLVDLEIAGDGNLGGVLDVGKVDPLDVLGGDVEPPQVFKGGYQLVQVDQLVAVQPQGSPLRTRCSWSWRTRPAWRARTCRSSPCWWQAHRAAVSSS